MNSRVFAKVKLTASGRLYLMLKEGGSRDWADCKSRGLFGNQDRLDFYRALAKKFAEMSCEGCAVEFIDTQLISVPEQTDAIMVGDEAHELIKEMFPGDDEVDELKTVKGVTQALEFLRDNHRVITPEAVLEYYKRHR